MGNKNVKKVKEMSLPVINDILIAYFDEFWEKLVRGERKYFLSAYSKEFGETPRTFYNSKRQQSFNTAQKRFISQYFSDEEYKWLLDDIITEEIATHAL